MQSKQAVGRVSRACGKGNKRDGGCRVARKVRGAFSTDRGSQDKEKERGLKEVRHEPSCSLSASFRLIVNLYEALPLVLKWSFVFLLGFEVGRGGGGGGRASTRDLL